MFFTTQHNIRNSFLNFCENRILFINEGGVGEEHISERTENTKKKIAEKLQKFIAENFSKYSQEELKGALKFFKEIILNDTTINEEKFLNETNWFDETVEALIMNVQDFNTYNWEQSETEHRGDVINFSVENIKNMPAKKLIATMDYYFKNLKNETISNRDYYNKIFDFVAKSISFDEILKGGENEELEAVKDIKEVQKFIALHTDLEGEKDIDNNFSRRRKKAILNLLRLQSITDNENEELKNASTKEDRIKIETKFNKKRNEIKNLFHRIIRQNILDEKQYLVDSEKNNELFQDMLFGTLGDFNEKGKYEIFVGGTEFKIQCSVGPIKKESAMLEKLKNKGGGKISDVLRCRIVIESPSHATGSEVNALNKRLARIFTEKYSKKEKVSKIKISGASIKEGANRPGAKSLFSLQSTDSKVATPVEIQVIPSVEAMNKLNLGLLNHNFYAWKKSRLQTDIKNFIPGHGILEKEIRIFINDFFNDIDLNYNESRTEFRELCFSEIYKNLIKDLESLNSEYFNANYIIKNRNKNLNAVDQPRLYTQMLKGIQLKLQNSALFSAIKDKIYSLPVEGETEEEVLENKNIQVKKLIFKAMEFRRTIEDSNVYQEDLEKFLSKILKMSNSEIENIRNIHKSIFSEEEIDSIIKEEEINLSPNQKLLLKEAKKQNVLPSEFEKLMMKHL